MKIPAMPTVLVIDDNPAVGTALDVLFSLHDIRSLRAETPKAGLGLLAGEDVDLVIRSGEAVSIMGPSGPG